MNKKKTSIKLLTAALIVNGIYLLILVLMTCFQKWIKTSVQNAPLGARTTFYFPYDDVIFAAVCLVLMLAISLVLISRVKAGAKTGALPVCGMVFFGVLVPYLSQDCIAFGIFADCRFSGCDRGIDQLCDECVLCARPDGVGAAFAFCVRRRLCRRLRCFSLRT